MRVLIAEDERITRASVKRQLERWGHEVVAAENGREAWEYFCADRFDIILTDWEMPEMSGVELVSQIRASQRPDFVYVILLTSRSDKSDIVSGIEAGADDFVSKPFDRDELRVRLLAGERVVQLERRLSAQNDELRQAGERMRRDLAAASHVQHAMLPSEGITNEHVCANFQYIPTDELAGDGLGFHLIDDRHLVAYVVDVTGHGVPAALLAVNAMHALSPAAGLLGTQLTSGGQGPSPAAIVSVLNERFCAGGTGGRFLTMVLCILDTHTGRMRFARAGHPIPVVARAGRAVVVSDEGGLPLGIFAESEFQDVEIQLHPKDRVFLYSDGCSEQLDRQEREQFGDERFISLLISADGMSGEQVLAHAVHELVDWAGVDQFHDDVSLLAFEWLGP